MIEEDPKHPHPHPSTDTPRKQRRPSMPELLTKLNQLNHQHNHQHNPKHDTNTEEERESSPNQNQNPNPFCQLTDETVTKILSKLPISQHGTTSLVCKRFLALQGRLVRSLTLLDWDFLESSRLTSRFPELTHLNLAPASFRGNTVPSVVLSNKFFTIGLDTNAFDSVNLMMMMVGVVGSERVDRGMEVVSAGCRNLRKLVVVNASEAGLGSVGERCDLLQELEMYGCGDESLRGVRRFTNLQIVKLVGSVEGVCDSSVTDIGLTMLAQGCRRLVRLELSGCEGSYDGVKAIGQCCVMLEELIVGGCRMDGGWLSALAYCGNLKTLRIVGCEEGIDKCPGRDEHLGRCPMVEELFVERCDLRDKESVRALFLVCENVREVDVKDCWGLEDDVFRFAVVCRYGICGFFLFRLRMN